MKMPKRIPFRHLCCIKIDYFCEIEKQEVMRSQLRVANKALVKKQKGNIVVNFLINFLLPIFFLTKYALFCDLVGTNGILFPFKLGTAHNQVAANALVISLSFPVGYYLYSQIRYKQTNIISVFGFVSVLLTGVVGLFELSSQWMAIKDGLIPLIMGVLILLTLKMKPPLLMRMVCNEELMDLDKVEECLDRNHAKRKWFRLFKVTTWLFFFDFVVSSVTHYALAVYVLVDKVPTNEQIAELMYLKYPYSVLPFGVCIVLTVLYFFHGLTKLTGMTFEEMFPEK